MKKWTMVLVALVAVVLVVPSAFAQDSAGARGVRRGSGAGPDCIRGLRRHGAESRRGCGNSRGDDSRPGVRRDARAFHAGHCLREDLNRLDRISERPGGSSLRAVSFSFWNAAADFIPPYFILIAVLVSEEGGLEDEIDDGIWHQAEKNCADRGDGQNDIHRERESHRSSGGSFRARLAHIH